MNKYGKLHKLINLVRRSQSCLIILLIFILFTLACSFYCSDPRKLGQPIVNKKKYLRQRSMNLPKMMQQNLIPAIIYGTAWKKMKTKELVELAIKSGFRAIDTACQPKHYFEPGVGEALQHIYDTTNIKREDLFLQTKFTSLDGQDPQSIPYDKSKSLHDQVLESFQKSCENLRTLYIDSYIMHSPMKSYDETMEVWFTFEQLYHEKKVLNLGISNIYDIELLKKIFQNVNVKPKFIQNRFYKQSGYDSSIRNFCKSNGILYQSFWTLTANPHILSSPVVQKLSKKYNKTVEQIFFYFIRSQDIIFLTGTKSEDHMKMDLEAAAMNTFSLEQEEIDSIKSLLDF